jgi:hypothetical protein
MLKVSNSLVGIGLPVLFLLALLGGCWMAARCATARRNGQFRRQLKHNTWLLLWLVFALWPFQLAVLWQGVRYREWPSGSRLVALAGLLVMTLCLLSSRRKLVRQAAAEPPTPLSPKEPTAPSLRLQLALIFLPVLGLAA